MIATVELPPHLKQLLREEALRAAPRECCGLLEGAVDGSAIRVAALHPVANIANEADRFEIDPAGHIALLRELRGTERRIIGCYHSHPNGRAAPSARDCEGAVEPDFLWLICAIDNGRQATGVAAYVSDGQMLMGVPVASVTGTERRPGHIAEGEPASEPVMVPGVDRITAPLL